MKFTLEIELGNDAMQTPEDVREALLSIARDYNTLTALTAFGMDDSGSIRDINGNRVGHWEVTED